MKNLKMLFLLGISGFMLVGCNNATNENGNGFDNSKNIIKRDLSDSIKLSYGIFYRKNADDQLIKKIIKCFI